MPPGENADRTTLVATIGVPHWGQLRVAPAAPLRKRLALAVLLSFSAMIQILLISKYKFVVDCQPNTKMAVPNPGAGTA
jgi:hypothetical protein